MKVDDGVNEIDFEMNEKNGAGVFGFGFGCGFFLRRRAGPVEVRFFKSAIWRRSLLLFSLLSKVVVDPPSAPPVRPPTSLLEFCSRELICSTSRRCGAWGGFACGPPAQGGVTEENLSGKAQPPDPRMGDDSQAITLPGRAISGTRRPPRRRIRVFRRGNLTPLLHSEGARRISPGKKKTTPKTKMGKKIAERSFGFF